MPHLTTCSRPAPCAVTLLRLGPAHSPAPGAVVVGAGRLHATPAPRVPLEDLEGAAAARRGDSAQVRDKLAAARAALTDAGYRSALAFLTDSVLLTWEECLHVGALLDNTVARTPRP